MIEIATRASFKGKEVIGDSKWQFKYDGYRLDFLRLSVILTNTKDFEELETFLKVHKRCFTVAGNSHNQNQETDDIAKFVEVYSTPESGDKPILKQSNRNNFLYRRNK